MIKAIIIDDEVASIEVIRTLVHTFSNEIAICSTCLTIDDAVRETRLHKPDILFLDIELADGLGFEILEQLPDLHPHVIFITAYDHYAIRAIRFHAFDYLLKPVIPGEMHQTLNKVIMDIKEQHTRPDSQALLHQLRTGLVQKIAVPSKNGLHYYPIQDIVLIEGDGSYAVMHLANANPVTVTKKIKNFEELLSDKGFIRIHKSFLVNTDHIRELHRDDSGYLVMSNGKKVPISPKDKEEIIHLIKQVSNIV